VRTAKRVKEPSEVQSNIFSLINSTYYPASSYRIYLRLFIIMGGSWFLEIIAFVCEMENVLQPLVALNDYINCSQGMIIFMATFCNQEMLKSIRKR